jgi:phosphate transport system permease protein
MSAQTGKLINQTDSEFHDKLRARRRTGSTWRRYFYFANFVGLIALVILLGHIINQAFGMVVVRYTLDPDEVSAVPLEELDEPALLAIIAEQQPNRIRVMIRDRLSTIEANQFTTQPLRAALANATFPEAWNERLINDLSIEEQLLILETNLARDDVYDLVVEEVLRPRVIRTWSLIETLTQRDQIEAIYQEQYPRDDLIFRSWASLDFVSSSVSSSATTAGLRTALLGSAWIISITAVIAFPLGVGAAIYLEEYARDNWFNRIIEINIRNLAAVPSIIYGMLGLAVFALALRQITSGAVFGVGEPSGRTVISAALTLALLILPVIIIQSQEAIRAVPQSLRDASYGLGATKWQTVSRQVLPVALPGILTGVILAMSRAVGETAPLLVVGASTFIGVDPNGPFSKFTVVPIQIYQWTARPEAEFRSVAAAAIIVLLIVLLSLNSVAIILRNRFSRRLA